MITRQPLAIRSVGMMLPRMPPSQLRMPMMRSPFGRNSMSDITASDGSGRHCWGAGPRPATWSTLPRPGAPRLVAEAPVAGSKSFDGVVAVATTASGRKFGLR